MHIARRYLRRAYRAAARSASAEPSFIRMSSRDWDFFVANEVEAFAVLARHDIDDIEFLSVN